MNEFMEIALQEAEKGIQNKHGGPFGCVIVKDGKVIARAHNQVLKKQDATCHGEMQAIRKACKKLKTFDLSGCELYTTGQPCPMCLSACVWANISKIYYGCTLADNEQIGFRDKKIAELLTSKGHKELLICIDRQECLELFEKFQSQHPEIY